MPSTLTNCPDPKTLADFLLGKLPTDAIEDCRQHLVDCDPCVDTIRGLKVEGDTMHDLSREAWLASVQENRQPTESQVVGELMNRMEQLSGLDELAQVPNANVIEDRAAEVQRLLSPPIDEHDLGKLGKYRIRQLLGAGSTGVVYQAIDGDLDRTVAIKILRPSLGKLARERFIAEARATAKLQHPNVVQIYEVGVEGPLAFISMMWEPGQTLEQMLETETNLPVDDVRILGTQLAEALEHAHQRSLIHRDIKPANVWIPDEHGVTACKVLDFGLVRITDEDPQLTCTGMIAGTPCYMSPEQSRGQELDGRSDLFSLGCVLFQALTGQLPFRSDNALSTLQSIQRDQPTAPDELDPSIPSDLSDLVMCLLEKSPNRRPPNAAAVGIALTCRRSEWPFAVELSSPVKAKPKPQLATSSSLWKFVATLVVGLGLGVFGLMYGPHITSIVTDHGTIEIDSKVDDVKIEVLQNGQQIRVIDLATEQSISIKSGSYEIRPMGDQNSIQIANDVLTLTRGEKEIVTITRKPHKSSDTENVDSAQNPFDRNVVTANPNVPYTLDSGDILGVFIEGVVGEFGTNPPVNNPPPGSGLRPSTGFPYLIDDEGEIALPLIQPQLFVRGMTVQQVEALIRRAYEEGADPILKGGGRIIVSLVQDRQFALAQPQRNVAEKPKNRPFAPPDQTPYTLAAGDILGVFVDGVLGAFESGPPVHFPEPGSNLPPSMGFPVAVESEGHISLPLIESISVNGKTVSEAKKSIVSAFMDGDNPILKRDARILVSLMRKRETNAPSLAQSLDSGDVLGVFIEGVLGGFEDNPPVHIPPIGSGLHPSIGYPVVVDEDGLLSLPLVKPISVRGKTLAESKKLIVAAFEEGETPILKPGEARIIISLMQKRGYVPSVTSSSLRERIVELKIALGQAKQSYGPKHVRIQNIEEELKILEQELSQSLSH